MGAESAERRAAPLKTSPFFAALGGALGLLWGGAAEQETSATNPPPHLTHVHFLFSVSLVFIFSFSISFFGVTMVIVVWGGAAEQDPIRHLLTHPLPLRSLPAHPLPPKPLLVQHLLGHKPHSCRANKSKQGHESNDQLKFVRYLEVLLQNQSTV